MLNWLDGWEWQVVSLCVSKHLRRGHVRGSYFDERLNEFKMLLPRMYLLFLPPSFSLFLSLYFHLTNDWLSALIGGERERHWERERDTGIENWTLLHPHITPFYSDTCSSIPRLKCRCNNNKYCNIYILQDFKGIVNPKKLSSFTRPIMLFQATFMIYDISGAWQR